MRKPLGNLTIAVALVGAMSAQAHGPGPEYVPIARLIQNLNNAIQKNPKDTESYYLLGRVHYFAFMAPPKDTSTKPETLRVHQFSGGFSFASNSGSDDPGKSKAPGPRGYTRTPKQQIVHVRAAVTRLQQGLRLRGDKVWSFGSEPGLYELCLACALEEGAKYAPKVGPLPGLSATATAWRDAAIQNYWLAYERTEASDLKEQTRSTGKLVAEEAGEAYIRLIKQRGRLSATEIFRMGRITIAVKKMQSILTYVTPVIFSLKPQATFSNMVAPHQQVRFNLDGTGRRQQLSWVSPETAILCWDPAGTGKITSGKQLFGSVTWWMFWRDGYAAMAALDDNHDGWLTGRELSGLALWFDRNQNGVSNPGEVVPIAQTPVAGLATTATSEESGSPRNAAGLRMRDGSTLPTWDWIATVKSDGT
ncbi:hypothetical protein [Armatimonas sp.]|uniref:hypothetical protein n=1 Tax=Armatimonas sp. TaxID=1872638 RepID=UPI00286C9BB1|nr:hypothetical protein [Armatimonas sp.]